MYDVYDLQLDHGGGDDYLAGIQDESVTGVDDGVTDDEDAPGKRTTAVKVLSGKSNDDIKKMLETFRENQSVRDVDDSIGDHLFNEFSDILSIERSGAVN